MVLHFTIINNNMKVSFLKSHCLGLPEDWVLSVIGHLRNDGNRHQVDKVVPIQVVCQRMICDYSMYIYIYLVIGSEAAEITFIWF